METLSKTLAATLRQLAKLAKAYDRNAGNEYQHSPHLAHWAQHHGLPYDHSNPDHEFHLVETGGTYESGGTLFIPGMTAIIHNKRTGAGQAFHLKHQRAFYSNKIPPRNAWQPQDFTRLLPWASPLEGKYQLTPNFVKLDTTYALPHIEAIAGLARKHGIKTLKIQPRETGHSPSNTLYDYENLLDFTVKHNIPTPKFNIIKNPYSNIIFGTIDPVDLTNSATDRHGNPIPYHGYFQGKSPNPSNQKYIDSILKDYTEQARKLNSSP